MKPAAFDYVVPATMEEALDALHQAGGDARVIAGGQSLVPMLNMRLARPAVLVDIMRIAGLRDIRRSGDSIMIGAGIRQAQLETWSELSGQLPLVAMALPWLGHVQTRARARNCLRFDCACRSQCRTAINPDCTSRKGASAHETQTACRCRAGFLHRHDGPRFERR